MPMAVLENKEDIIRRVEHAMEKMRPYLEADGGDMCLVDITDDYVARVELLGACSNCSMSMMTLKAGIEEAVKREVPEIREVIAVNI